MEEDDSSEGDDEGELELDAQMNQHGMCGLVRERGMDLMMRKQLSEEQSQLLRGIAEEC